MFSLLATAAAAPARAVTSPAIPQRDTLAATSQGTPDSAAPFALPDNSTCPDPAQAGTPVRSIPNSQLRKTVQPAQGTMSWAVSGLPELTAMSDAISRSLEATAVVFPGVRGPVSAFLPGRDYQEIYIRDTASALLVTPYLYPDLFLRSAVEEFLFRQWTAPATLSPRPGQPAFPGLDAIYGLIAPDGWADKSTATSDEEPSLVLSAYRYVRSAGGRSWLDCDIQGRTVLERLHAALDHLVVTRTDAATGLVVRAHTTDWGDVRMQGGQQPTHADSAGETWTISIYDQAVVYQAMRHLAELHRLAGDHSAGQLWDQRADALRAQANRFLWQPRRGFYRTHIHVTPLEHDFNEDQMVSIANAVAVYAGLADEARTRRIFDTLEATRIREGVGQPGLALSPPYPGGVFQHPNMNHWSYQNGALWDWWGAVQITGEFLTGHSERGLAHLSALAKAWQEHPGTVLEWQDPFGGPKRGSADYAAAAGTAAEAVIRGLFGVELLSDGFTLRPRLGGRDGFIQVQQPATGHALWARQRVQAGTLVLEYTASHSGGGMLEVLLPKAVSAAEVLLDGLPQDFSVRQQGDDRFLTVGHVAPGTHRLDVALRPEAAPPVSARWEDGGAAIVASGRTTGIPVTLRNTGPASWKNIGAAAIGARARWLNADGQASPELDALTQRLELFQEVASGSSITLRPALRTPERPGAYRLRWEALAGPDGATTATMDMSVQVTPTALGRSWPTFPRDLVLPAGRAAQIPLVAENTGFETWQTDGLNPVRVGYRWYRSDGREVRFAGSDQRVALGREVAPGETVRVTAQVVAPPLPGRYALRVDLVQEPGTWFSGASASPTTADILVQVVP